MKTATVVTVVLPMLVLFFPLLDTSWAVVRRLARGKSIFAPDAEHIHHRLLDRVKSQKKVAFIIYAFSAALGLLATYFVHQQWYYLTVGGGILLMAVFFAEVLNRHRQRRGALPAEGVPEEPDDAVLKVHKPK